LTGFVPPELKRKENSEPSFGKLPEAPKAFTKTISFVVIST
jgi:hypothetical protein